MPLAQLLLLLLLMMMMMLLLMKWNPDRIKNHPVLTTLLVFDSRRVAFGQVLLALMLT